MTKTDILSLATIAAGIGVLVLAHYIVDIFRLMWLFWRHIEPIGWRLIIPLVGIALILIGIARLTKTKKKEIIERRS